MKRVWVAEVTHSSAETEFYLASKEFTAKKLAIEEINRVEPEYLDNPDPRPFGPRSFEKAQQYMRDQGGFVSIYEKVVH
jgi:hypothetical protein